MGWVIGMLKFAAIAVIVAVMGLAGAIIFGGGSPPPPMESVIQPFAAVDGSGLPARESLTARDGTALAYRVYPGAGDEVVLALHGSSTDGRSLHVMARELSEAGATVYVPDLRGHGASGPRGDVAYIGQLEDDIADFVAHIGERHPAAAMTLVGFSSGGGLALRYAGRQEDPAIDRLVLLSPMLGIEAPPYTAENPHAGDGEWARPFVPRIVALSVLNALGIHAFDHLPVIGFAVDPADAGTTATYSHRLLASMNPTDYTALLRAAQMPIIVLAGRRDEVFAAAEFPPTITEARPDATVRLIDGLGHVDITLEPESLAAIRAAVLH